MGTIWMPGGSGGADTSVVTATAEDVLAPKVIVGPDGEPITGEMANNGAVSHSLPVNGNYVIPKGFHNGAGKVSQSIPTQGGSTTVPGTAAKTIVAANRYVTGNVVVAGDPNLIPANIKKNVTIFGVRGTHSGYVPSATDLYLRGNNPAGIVVINGVVFDSGQMSIAASSGSTIQVAYNFAGYTKLNFEGATYSQGTGKQIVLQDGAGSGLANVTFSTTPPNNFTQSIDISALQKNATWRILFKGIGLNSSAVGAIYRIWLS